MSLGTEVYEGKTHWVGKVAKGYVVYKMGTTHSTKVATIGYTGEEGLQKAIAECQRRDEKAA